MAVKASGSPLSFSEIETEFGQNSDRDLGEYRVSQTVGGLSNQPLDTSIPQSGAIKFSDFYSKRLNVVIDYHSGSTENKPSDAKTKYGQANDGTTGESEGFWNVIGGFRNPPTDTSGTKTRIHVNKTIGSATGNVNNCAVRTGTGWDSGTVLTVEVGSSGAIVGAGGNGGHGSEGSGRGEDGFDGTSGLGVQYTPTTINSVGGSVISAGFGGGGGGGGGHDHDKNSERTASGAGGGGGAGVPAGAGGVRGEGGTRGGPGTSGTADTAGEGGGGSNNGNEAFGGAGGEGGSNGEAANDGGRGAGGEGSGGAKGEGGSDGAAIRRTNTGISVTINGPVNIKGAYNPPPTGVSEN